MITEKVEGTLTCKNITTSTKWYKCYMSHFLVSSKAMIPVIFKGIYFSFFSILFECDAAPLGKTSGLLHLMGSRPDQKINSASKMLGYEYFWSSDHLILLCY